MSDHQRPRPTRRPRPTSPSHLQLVPARPAGGTGRATAGPAATPATAGHGVAADLLVAVSFAFTGGWLPGDLVAARARDRSVPADADVLVDLATLAVVHQQAADQEPPPEWARHLRSSHRRLAAAGIDVADGLAGTDIALVARALLDALDTDRGRRTAAALERWLWQVPLVTTLAPPPGHWPPTQDPVDAAGLALIGADEPQLPDVLLLRLLFERPYVPARRRLAQVVAAVGGCIALPEPAIDAVVLVGLEPAVDGVARLARRVEHRALDALACTPTLGPARSFRASFLLGYARAVTEDLRAEASDRGVPGPALFGIEPEVADGLDVPRDLACIALSTGLTPSRRRVVARSVEGWVAGQEAARVAPVTQLLRGLRPAPTPAAPPPGRRPGGVDRR